MNRIFAPFPFTIAGVNVTIPAGLMLVWLLLFVFNVTAWLILGAITAVETF